jgi:cytosine/adenosine deaminase-related metal-dependent hydrolase
LEKTVLLRGGRVAMNSGEAVKLDLWVSGGRISLSPVPTANITRLSLDGCITLPGLINAHDHLELNLFPRLGRGPYSNASLWAEDIYRPDEPPVKQHLLVAKELRLRWGAIKNLLSGVTTVAHHNPFDPVFLEPGFPVRVIRQYGWAHSLHFSPDWETRLRETPADTPFVIHAAEGTDEAAQGEIRILAKAGALNRATVLVHAVGASRSDIALLSRTKASVVWCPTSNHFTLSRTLSPAVLDSAIPVALGTDSAITSDGDLLDELRVARQAVDADRLYAMVTSEPARIFNLPTGFGQICHGGPADLIVMRDRGHTPAMTLLEDYPLLVIVRGRIHLVSSEFAHRCPSRLLGSLQPLDMEGRGRYLVAARVSSLWNTTTQALQQPLRLAGKAIAA